jgi:hypothetical protein
MGLTEEDKQFIKDVVLQTVQTSEARTFQLVTDVKESLERELAVLQTDIRGTNIRLDNMSARLDRQDGWLRAGARRIGTIEAWAAKVDKALDVKDVQIADLRKRLDKSDGM